MDSKLHNRRHNGLGSSLLHGGGGRKSIQGNEEIILRGRWPSSSSSKKITPDNSLADYLASDGLAELLIADKKKSKSKSNEKGPQFGHPSEETKKNNEDQEDERIGRNMSKENRTFGSSMRYIGKLKFPKSILKSDILLQPGRMSVDENALAAMRRKGTTDFNIEIPSTDSERSESTKGKSPRIPRARTKDSERSKSIDRAPAISKIATAPIRRSSSSLTGNNNIQSNMSQWALSPGRRSHSPSVPPPPMMSTINDGSATATPLRSFSSLRPDGYSDHKLNNSNKKVVGNILTIGLDLFRKKTGTSTKPTRPSSPVLAAGDVEYRFSMLYNCLIRWRYANARSDAMNRTRKDASQNALLNAWLGIAKMQTTVMEKKIQLQREKLSFKLDKMLSGQINSLEGWGDQERQHMQFFSKTQNCLEAAVCRLPLVDKAKADPQLLSFRFRQATNLNESIKSTLGLYTSPAEDIVPLISELAHVVDKEKLLLEECLEMMADFSAMQIKEESLLSQLVQLKSC